MNTNNKFSDLLILLSLIFALIIGLGGCQSQQVAGIATEAASPTPVPSDTPVPTSTNTPVPTDTPTPSPTPTWTPTATPNRKATQAAVQTATQEAVDEMVGKELEKYNIDPTLGRVVWMLDGSLELDGGGYATSWYQPIQELGVLKDFVVQTEIIWDTSSGLAGCGYIFRAREDWDLAIGDYYEVFMIRLQNAPKWYFDYYKDGRWVYTLPNRGGVYSSKILDGKMSKNTLTLEARGETFTIYINGVKDRTVRNNKITEGRLAFQVVQESGSSYCKFTKGWVWAYDD
jgi:hypothetical protein